MIIKFENYKPFKIVIIENKKKFITLFFLLLVEVLVLTSSIISTIPLVDFIIDPQPNNPNKFTQIILNFIDFFYLNPSLILFLCIFVFSNILKKENFDKIIIIENKKIKLLN